MTQDENRLTHVSVAENVAPSDGYSHIVSGTGQLAAIAGQMSFDESGNVVGEGDPEAQARQAFFNMRQCLATLGAGMRDLIKLNCYVTNIAHVPVLLNVRDEFIDTARPPASTVVEVRALYRPDLLLEIDGLALVPSRPA